MDSMAEVKYGALSLAGIAGRAGGKIRQAIVGGELPQLAHRTSALIVPGGAR